MLEAAQAPGWLLQTCPGLQPLRLCQDRLQLPARASCHTWMAGLFLTMSGIKMQRGLDIPK